MWIRLPFGAQLVSDRFGVGVQLRFQDYQFSNGFSVPPDRILSVRDSLHGEVSRSGYISYSRVTASLAVSCNNR